MEVVIAFGGIVLGWILGAATEMWRESKRARIALMIIHNELLGNMAQLDLALRADVDEPPQPSRWYKRWKLTRTAWEQQGALAMLRLDGEDAWTVHGAYHALDASELLFDEAREGVVALGQAVGNLGDPAIAAANPAAAEQFASLDALSREKLRIQLDALSAAHQVLDRHLGLSHP